MSVYHQVRRTVGRISPEVFLRLGAGGPRGFWARGDGWVAHCGVVEDIVQPAVGAPEARFRGVEDRVRSLARDGPTGDSFRIYGGFSFSPDHAAEGVWSEFPPARFHLPAAELEFDPRTGDTGLSVRDTDPERAASELIRWTEALGAVPRTAAGAAGALAGNGPVPPTRGMDRATWGNMIWSALQRIGSGDVDKVVLARTLEVRSGRQVPPLELAMALWQENRGSHVFLFEPVAGRAMVGAAPETVAALTNGQFRATAVAGSVGVVSDSIETAALGRRLFNSDKDRAEHDFVVNDMVDRLEAMGCAVRRDVEPHVLTLTRIQHLETKIAADVPPHVSLLDILGSLHPTPAVCGMPRDVALATLSESEVFERGWYAGPVGWLGSDGKGVFVPALRSAVCSDGTWLLFAGAGIVPGSDPALEWDETGLKFQPILRAMVRAGLSESVLVGSG